MEITTQYSDDRQLIEMTQKGDPWGTKSVDAGLELVDERLNEVVVLCQNCGMYPLSLFLATDKPFSQQRRACVSAVLYDRFFDTEMKSLDADYQRHVRTSAWTRGCTGVVAARAHS